jgi:hypothetical protein
MSEVLSGQQGWSGERQGVQSSADLSQRAQSLLTKVAAWISDHNVPFLVTSIGMIVMLLWAGSYKMTAPGAEGIIPLVSNSPLISWHFKLFGPYIGSDIIGTTEIIAAILMITGYFKRNADVLYHQHDGHHDTRLDYLRSWNQVHEFLGIVPFQRCHLVRRSALPGQLFRQESYPF